MSSNTPHDCLATVTTPQFMPGTLVMLHSFLKNNRWFQGDIVIIHDEELGTRDRESLSHCFQRVRSLSVSPELKDRACRLLAARPDVRGEQSATRRKEVNFFTLEIFRLQGYDKVLLCDGDLLFRQSVQELFALDEALVCCGNGPYYQGLGHDPTSFAVVPKVSTATTPVLRNTFNAGFLLVDRMLLSAAQYAHFLAMVDGHAWQTFAAPHTDRLLYNLCFAGRQTLVSCQYNYLLRYRAVLYEKERVSLTQAKVLHFNTSAKP